MHVMPDNPDDVLVERTFEVSAPLEQAWAALADVASWPEWAPHIASATVSPPGPLTASTSGRFRFRPAGRSRFVMTAFDPPRSWTWTGKALGVTIDYDHHFEALSPTSTRLRWVVRARGAPGLRGRLFASLYSRLLDRAWPRFVESLASTPPPPPGRSTPHRT